jgi:hypothetical protein
MRKWPSTAGPTEADPWTAPESGCGQFAKAREGSDQGAAAVAQAVLGLGRDLGERRSDRRQEKERVVAEATRPARGVKDGSLDGTPEEILSSIRSPQGEHADVPSRSIGRRNVAQLMEESAVVRFIQLGAREIRASRKALREHSGPTPQGIHAEAGIIGEHREPG